MELISDQVKISFVIPFYCTPAELFQNCMKSILGNDFQNLEVIVVDDGSTEEYQESLHAFCEDKRVRLFRNEHKGVSAARNRGIREARGKWIAFADSDDYVYPDTLKRILSHIDDFTGDMVLFGGGRDFNGYIRANTSFLKENCNYGEKTEDKLKIMESALSAGMLPPGYYQGFTYGSPCSKLFDRSFLEKNRLLFDEEVRFAEDVLFLMQAYIKAGEIYYFDWYLYSYVWNTQSATKKYRPGISDDIDVFFRKMTALLKENDLEEALEKAYYLRAEFEVMRSRRADFLHPANKNKDRKKKYKEFVRKEPYCTALKKRYYRGKGFGSRVYYFLVMHNLKHFYLFARKLYHMGDRRNG